MMNGEQQQPRVMEAEIAFVVRGKDECGIYSEIFGRHEYKIESDKALVVLDIGMNVGIASLYFARIPNVKYIYGYEPFPYTYQCALENFDLNPMLKQKIIPNFYGLSNEDKIVDGFIDYTYKGNSSVVRQTKWENDQVERVQLRKVSTVINQIMKSHPELAVFIKIDCEGGEIELFEDVDFLEQLRGIEGLVMETHSVATHQKIVGILEEKGLRLEHGMINGSNGYIKGKK